MLDGRDKYVGALVPPIARALANIFVCFLSSRFLQLTYVRTKTHAIDSKMLNFNYKFSTIK
jgi:hypothetical protein